MNEGASLAPRREAFALRLIGGIGVGAAVLEALYGLFMYLERIPRHRQIFADFDAELPGLTVALLQAPWIPFAGAAVAGALATLALVTANRLLLILAWVAIFASMVTILLAEYALWSPMKALIEAISG